MACHFLQSHSVVLLDLFIQYVLQDDLNEDSYWVFFCLIYPTYCGLKRFHVNGDLSINTAFDAF